VRLVLSASCAAALTVGAAATPPAPIPERFECRGNEPFWSLRLGPDTALLNVIGGEEAFRGSRTRLGALQPPWEIWRGTSTDDRTRTLFVAIREETCLDTMADVPPSDYRAVVSLSDGSAVTGCCSAPRALAVGSAPDADLSEKPEGDWSRDLLAWYPAIRACVLDAGVAAEAVPLAFTADGDAVGVVLADHEGRLHECVADLAGRHVLRVRVISPTEPPRPGLARPTLYPAREAPPTIEGGRVERVLDAGGRLLGYLHYR